MKFTYLAFPLAILLMAGCTSENTPSTNEKAEEPATQTEEVVKTTETSTDDSNTETTAEEPATAEETVTNSDNNRPGTVRRTSSSISDMEIASIGRSRTNMVN